MKQLSENQLGALVESFGMGAMLKYVSAALFMVSAVIALIMLFAFLFGSNKLYEDDQRLILLAVCSGIIVLSLVVVNWAFWCFVRDFNQVDLYEHGLMLTSRHYGQRRCLYAEIGEVYTYAPPQLIGKHYGPNGIYFVCEGETKWLHISGQADRYPQLRKMFLVQLTRQRGAVLLDRIAQGQSVTFCKISSSTFLSEFTKFKLPKPVIELDSSSLTVDSCRYPLSMIQMQYPNDYDWTNQLSILDLRGKTIYTSQVTSILSSHLLCALVETLQQRGAH